MEGIIKLLSFGSFSPIFDYRHFPSSSLSLHSHPHNNILIENLCYVKGKELEASLGCDVRLAFFLQQRMTTVSVRTEKHKKNSKKVFDYFRLFITTAIHYGVIFFFF